MTALPLLLLLTTAGPREAKNAPRASELAKLYFLAGDIRKATDTARLGKRSDPVRCKALYPMLVEYGFLVPRREELTLVEAKAFLSWDRKISPGVPGKITLEVLRRYIETPLQLARNAQQGGDVSRAQRLVEEVLQVDPANRDASGLRAALDSLDAGSLRRP